MLEDHDANDEALTAIGARLCDEAPRHAGDLDGLAHRIHARRQRSRLVVVAACVAVVLVLGTAVVLRTGSTATLDVVDVGVTSTGALPMWTVNRSIPVDPAGGEVWAVDIVFDPGVWESSTLNDVPALEPMHAFEHGGAVVVGSAGFRDEPRMQAYWQGVGAREAAEAARDELLAMPGIVSVEVGPAEPTSRPPGTSGVTPALPPSGPTTVRTLERPVLPDPRPTQQEILADGQVTDVEHDQAFWTWVECVEGAGARIQVRGVGEDGRYQYSISAGVPGADDCYERHFMFVDRDWQLARDSGVVQAVPGSGS